MKLMDVNPPYDSVPGVHHFQITFCSRKVQGNDRGKRPVQKPCGKTVMLPQNHLIPDRILDRGFLQDRVFGEIEQHGSLQKTALVLAVPAETGGKSIGGIRLSSVDKEVAVSSQICPVILLGDHFKKIFHSVDFDIADHILPPMPEASGSNCREVDNGSGMRKLRSSFPCSRI